VNGYVEVETGLPTAPCETLLAAEFRPAAEERAGFPNMLWHG